MPLTERPRETSFVEEVFESLDETVTEAVPALQTAFGCVLWIGLLTLVLSLALFFFAVMC